MFLPKFFLILIAVILAAFAGTPILFLLKKLIIDNKTRFILDWDGMLERALIVLLVFTKNYFVFLIPLVIFIRIFIYFYRSTILRTTADIINRSEPSLTYQKVKIKGILGIDLIGSPALAILVGLVAISL